MMPVNALPRRLNQLELLVTWKVSGKLLKCCD
jgi:hypothetical protein